MSHSEKTGRTLSRLLLVIALVFTFLIPARLWVSAQSSPAPLWTVRSIYTSEYGVDGPKGLAFSSVANTFLVMDESPDIVLVTMGEDNAGLQNVPEVQNNALNAAFDAQTDSLFVFKAGKSELVQIKADDRGLPDISTAPTRFGFNGLGIKNPQGIAFDPDTGRLFILDADKSQVVAVTPHPTLGFEADEAVRSNRVQRISLQNLGSGLLRGVAYNPNNGHLYVSEPAQKKLYELTQDGDLISTFDLASLETNNPSAMTFAPSGDTTDDPNIYNLFILDASADTSSASQIVEISLLAVASLPAGTTLFSTSLVHVIDTSKAAWNPSAPDTSGVDYWPLTGRLLISDSEVDEMSGIFTGKNVYDATLSGALISTCSTTNLSRTGFSNEPTGLAINPSNNRIYFSDDDANKISEVALGPDLRYCTADDTVTSVNVGTVYNIQDAEDVAYGNNTIFVAGGDAAEVYRIPLGANGVLGGGDDGPMTHWDTASLGFSVLEGLGYNRDNGTLLLASPKSGNAYLGEASTTGTLLRAYDLSYLSIKHREDVTFAPGSQNASIKDFYISDRGVDNNADPNENDGKVWEVRISGTSSPTATFTPGPSPTSTSTPSSSDLIFADGFESGNFSAWSSSNTDSGDLAVTNAAALVGSWGMRALIDDTNTIFVTDETPSAEPRYRARFYFDPNSVTMASGDAHFIFRGLMSTGSQAVRVEFRNSSGAYQIRASALNDSFSPVSTNWFTISNAPHAIEIDWRAATGAGANNGGLTFWIDGTQQANLTGIDNDTLRVDRGRIGALGGVDAGTSGAEYFDAFVSRRQTYIGP